jgi:hypothetical protein
VDVDFRHGKRREYHEECLYSVLFLLIKSDDEFEVEHGRIKSVCFPCWKSKCDGNIKVVVLAIHVTKISFLV